MPDSPVAAAGLQQFVPLLGVRNMGASLRFYVDGLGFRMTNAWTPEGAIRWCWLEQNGVAVMLQEFTASHRPPAEATLGAGVGLTFVCGDALALYRAVSARGLPVQRPFVGNSMWVTTVTDPDGYELHFESMTDAPEESEYHE